MRTLIGGLRPALIAAVMVFAVASPAATSAGSRCNDNWPLHAGSCGPRVADLQWLLGGHRPNVFTEVKPTFHWKPNGAFGARTKSAVTAYKYRIGYPKAGQCGSKGTMLVATTGPQFFAIIEGRAKRPTCWVALAAARVKAIVAATPTPLALKIEKVEQSQVGVTELCCDSHGNSWNRGVAIDAYSRYFHLPLGLAYCVIFQQWSFARAGFVPPFANGTSSAYAVADFYAAKNQLFAKPRFAAIVIFVDYNSRGQRIPGTGHVAFVVRVTASGYYTIEGNTGYGHDAGVRPRFHGFHDRGNVFAYVKGVTTR